MYLHRDRKEGGVGPRRAQRPFVSPDVVKYDWSYLMFLVLPQIHVQTDRNTTT